MRQKPPTATKPSPPPDLYLIPSRSMRRNEPYPCRTSLHQLRIPAIVGLSACFLALTASAGMKMANPDIPASNALQADQKQASGNTLTTAYLAQPASVDASAT